MTGIELVVFLFTPGFLTWTVGTFVRSKVPSQFVLIFGTLASAIPYYILQTDTYGYDAYSAGFANLFLGIAGMLFQVFIWKLLPLIKEIKKGASIDHRSNNRDAFIEESQS